MVKQLKTRGGILFIGSIPYYLSANRNSVNDLLYEFWCFFESTHSVPNCQWQSIQMGATMWCASQARTCKMALRPLLIGPLFSMQHIT